jgi:hypothetical protein
MGKLIFLICGFLMAPIASQAADVYKWKDTEGKVRYSDTPPSGKAPYELIPGKKTPVGRDLPEAAAPPGLAVSDKSAKPLADRELEARKRKAEADNLQKKEQEKLEQQRLRDENCATAKANLQNYKLGGRLFKINEKGERQYLEDKDIADAVEKANREVERWCSSL